MKRIAARVLFVPTLTWNMCLGRWLRVRRWWDEIDADVLMGALPFARDVAPLADLGVRGVVNTCEEYGGPVRAYKTHGIEQLRIPTIDFTPPSLKSIREAVEFIEGQVNDGHRVYVHCKAGRGRSATVVLSWLMARHGMSPEDGQRLLLERRPHVHRQLARRAVIQEFWNELNSSQHAVERGQRDGP